MQLKTLKIGFVATATVGSMFLVAPSILAEEQANVVEQEQVVSQEKSENSVFKGQASKDSEVVQEDASKKSQSIQTSKESEVVIKADNQILQDEQLSDSVNTHDSQTAKLRLVDANATQETKELYTYLKSVSNKKDILFGQQHALDEGVTLTSEGNRVGSKESDVKNAVGDYPAVFGWDTLSIDGYEKPGVSGNVTKSIENLSNSMKTAHELGGILTLSTHPHNFVTGGDFNDTSGNVVSSILPGGSHNAAFNQWLDNIAALADSLRDKNGKTIPFIFRPFHEQTGSWFWWGEGSTNPEQYKALYRYTVEYLRDKKNIHNILYAYSPGAGNNRYFKTYPGDEYIDILGIDSYDNKDNAGSSTYVQSLLNDLKMIVKEATSRGKIATLTEFGYSAQGLKEKGNTLDWYTRIFKAIQNDEEASKIAYMFTWANFNRENNLYTPYKDINGNLGGDHELLADFQKFYQDTHTLFRKDVGKIYGTNRLLETEPNDLTRYLIRPVMKEILTNKTQDIVVKALQTDTKVTYAIGDEPEKELLKVGDYFVGNMIIPATKNKQAITFKLTYYQDGQMCHEETYRLFVKLPDGKPVNPLVVDDFEDYLGENELLEKQYSSNGDPIKLSLSSEKINGNYGLHYQYTIAGNGYAGRQISFDKNWEQANALSFWMKSVANPGKHLTVQIQVGGVSFEKDIDLKEPINGKLTIPFSDFKPASWESHQSAYITKERLKKVTQFALYVGGATGSGDLYFDQIQATTDLASKAVPDKEEEAGYKALEYNFEQNTGNWSGNNAQVKDGALTMTVSTRSGEKTEVKLTQGLDLSSYNWYVVRLKSNHPVSARLFLKIGDSWQWVNSDFQTVTGEYTELRFPIEAIQNRDATKEIGIEFLGLSTDTEETTVAIDFVKFVKDLKELQNTAKDSQPEISPVPQKELETHKCHISKGKPLPHESLTQKSGLEKEKLGSSFLSFGKRNSSSLPQTGEKNSNGVIGWLLAVLGFFFYLLKKYKKVD